MIEILILALLLCFMGGVAYLRRDQFVAPGTKKANEGTFAAFEKAESLFVNSNEARFYHVLHAKLPKSFLLHAKVRLEDIVGVKPDIKNERMRWHLRARVKSRHVDFLITDLNGRPTCAIELDGAIHNRELTENADALKDGIFKAVGIPLIRVSTGADFTKTVQSIICKLTSN